MLIESGPTGERQARSIGTFLLVLVFALWFAYDGWIGYPSANFQEMLAKLPPDERSRAEGSIVYPSVTQDVATEAGKALSSASGREAALATLGSIFGGPPSFETENAWHYFGPALQVSIPLEGGRPVGRVIASEPTHKAMSLVTQQGLAAVLGLLALIAGLHVVRVLRTRLVLDDAGIAYRGRGSVSWNEVVGFEGAEFLTKGWVDLRIRQGGRDRTIRLDSYHLSEFDAIISAICEQRGYVNPIPAPTEAANTA